MTTIKSITAQQRLDSRGNPTVQVQVETKDGFFRALVPSGASTGAHEAVELRDGKAKDAATKGIDTKAYLGRGVMTAVGNVNDILGPALIKSGLDVATQLKDIDQAMIDLDGTPNKARLGANAILGVSMAVARAGAAARGVPLYEYLRKECGTENAPYVLPVPFFNVLNGGVHAGNTLAFQEFMLAPTGASSFEEAIQIGSEAYHSLKTVIAKKHGMPATSIGDEGGFAPPLTRPEEAFDLLTAAVKDIGGGDRVQFGLDPASTEFFDAKTREYDLGFKDKQPSKLSPDGLAKLYHHLAKNYPLALLEDPFAEDDWESWTAFTESCKGLPLEIVGDDLLVTNVKRVREAVSKKACNAMLLKINQIGSVTEAIAAARLAFSNGWAVFASHRSGETTDDFLADLTVALNTGHLKAGAPARGERVAKYNRLLDIEAELKAGGKTVVYAGANFGRRGKPANE